jgi:hypothetical protein
MIVDGFGMPAAVASFRATNLNDTAQPHSHFKRLLPNTNKCSTIQEL